MPQSIDEFYAGMSTCIDVHKDGLRVTGSVSVQKMLIDAKCSIGLADDVLIRLTVPNLPSNTTHS